MMKTRHFCPDLAIYINKYNNKIMDVLYGTTPLFLLVPYIIASRLQEANVGLKTDKFNTKALLFADYGPLLPESKEQCAEPIRILTGTTITCKLEINKQSSQNLMY